MTGSTDRGLEASPLFATLDSGRIAAILGQADVRAFRRQEVLFREGEPAGGMYLLADGWVKLTQLTPRGREVIVGLVAPREVFAAVVALPGADRYPASAVALTTGTVAFWPRPVAQRLAAEEPELLAALLRSVSERMRELQVRLRELSGDRVPARLAALLERLAQTAGRRERDGVRIDFPLTRRELAEMTGTTLYTVSRVLSEWAERGWVELGRGRVTIRALERLHEVAADG